MRLRLSISNRRLVPASLVISAAFFVSACAGPALLALGGGDIVSFTQTGRTLTDHTMSLVTDQNCSVQHTISGKPWCLPSTPSQPPQSAGRQELHCYRSIAAITCYRHSNPHDTASRVASGPERVLNQPVCPGRWTSAGKCGNIFIPFLSDRLIGRIEA